MNTAVGRLIKAELKLMTRDPLVLTFVFAFPIVTMLIIGGAFGTKPDRRRSISSTRRTGTSRPT